MPSKLLKFLLMSALPMFATEDDAAAAAGNDAGGASSGAQSTGETSASDALTSGSAVDAGNAGAVAGDAEQSALTATAPTVADVSTDASNQASTSTGAASTSETMQPEPTLIDGSTQQASDAFAGDLGNVSGAVADAKNALDGSMTAPNSDVVSSTQMTQESSLGSSGDAQEAGASASGESQTSSSIGEPGGSISTSDTSISASDAPAVAALGEGVASLAASQSASDTSLSVSSASQGDGTEGAIQTDADTRDWLSQHQEDYANGLKCSLHGLDATDMSRDELIAFVGFLDDTLTNMRLPKDAEPAQSAEREVHQGDYDAGLACSSNGVAVADMSRDELVAFVGVLDAASGGLGRRAAAVAE
ncbi:MULTISPECIES: hypothetical protein [unclassified Paraburkholderia]|uniref:hypothetical protein n=1 Tax=unclassified Paraburkholderia TaxID=2615204 RepID=UPI002AAF1DA4|nr:MULTISPECIES: hypothetical protein [unclassified Paraburkholderia]